MENKIFLKKVKLKNYKCFENTEVDFRNLTVIVGENNAGKSCLVEALRLVSFAAQQAKSKLYKQAPRDLNLEPDIKGFEIKVDKLKIDLKKAIYFYKDTVAKIIAVFSNGWKIEIHVTTELAFAVIFNSEDVNISNRSRIDDIFLESIGILPQIGLLRFNEKILNEKTIEEDKDTYLTSLHFRNEIRIYNQYFQDFKRLSEDTWRGLKVENVEHDSEYLRLYLTDNSFPAEVADMGSGIKMWLQIMWFLSRNKNCKVIILDEPDVYMHADLQRKLLDMAKQKYPQVIIATHSLEIIGRVEPENIVSVDKKSRILKYATDSNAVQSIIDNIGGMQNLSLIRLGLSRKCLFVEGKDLVYLNRFNEILYGKKLEIPIIEYGGFSKLSNVYGASKLLFSESKGSIVCYALADKDYRTKEANNDCIKKASIQKLELHIWEKKEIENYLLEPKILYKCIEGKNKESYKDFCKQIEMFVDEMKDSVLDGYADKLKQLDKSKEVSTCNAKARKIVNEQWTTLNNKISLVNGKDLIARIRDYCQEKYSITLTFKLIQEKFTEVDIPEEIKNVLKNLQ